MKHIIASLEGLLLNAAVGKAEGYEIDPVYGCNMSVRESGGAPSDWNPSTDWIQGGPIIEREGISLKCWKSLGRVWQASIVPEFAATVRLDCPTPLIAAMRAYVASKFGDTVDL